MAIQTHTCIPRDRVIFGVTIPGEVLLSVSGTQRTRIQYIEDGKRKIIFIPQKVVNVVTILNKIR